MKIWDILTKPSRLITDVGDYRKARLLTVFTLIFLLLIFALTINNIVNIDGYQLSPADLAGYLLLVLIYIASRTKHYQLGVIVAAFLFPANVVVNILQGTTQNPAITINFLVFSYIFVGIFLSLLWTGVYSFLVLSMIWLLPTLAPATIPDSSVVVSAFTINSITASLLLVSMYYRDRIEEERQQELRDNYENTLAGWSQALEFRDKETKGHSQRVTDLTVKLAAHYGIRNESELQHIRRGALLHDIGKMSISNQILLKAEPLNEEEWNQIRVHPAYAIEMLKDIPFLIPALDIPKSHHEKWDGSGYPNGLAGEEIPIAARIFAVVDVWDALGSQRPYRAAWPREKVLAYIEEQSGKHFDPQVVDKFLELIQTDEVA